MNRKNLIDSFKPRSIFCNWWMMLFAVIAMSLATSNAFAQFTGSVVPGAPSGGSGADRHFGDERRAVTAITYGERADDPCFLRLENVDPMDDSDRSSETFEECGSRGVNSRSRQRVVLPSSSFATGVRVCLNRNGDKVKGIQILGYNAFCLKGSASVVTRAGTPIHYDRKGPVIRPLDDIVTPCGSPKLIRQMTDTRANCDVTNGLTPVDSAGGWMTASVCPGSDMAMVGLRLSTDSGAGGRKIINGISAICRTLIQR